MERQKPHHPDPINSVSSLKRFGQYKEEGHSIVWEGQIKHDAAIRRLLGAWEKYDRVFKMPTHDMDEGDVYIYPYRLACVLVEDLHPLPSHVERFSITLSSFIEMADFRLKAGMFLSALINTGKHKVYSVRTLDYGEGISCLGMFNTKNVSIMGDVGEFACYCMKDGKVIINGDAGGGLADRLCGGIVVLNGNHMAGKEWYDISMEGGELHLNGDNLRLPDGLTRGKIFHKGVLVRGKP